jgi:hypothetical protein
MTHRHLRVRSLVVGAVAGALLIAPVSPRMFTDHAVPAAAAQASPASPQDPPPLPLPLPGGPSIPSPSPSPGGYQAH